MESDEITENLLEDDALGGVTAPHPTLTPSVRFGVGSKQIADETGDRAWREAVSVLCERQCAIGLL